MGEFSIHDAIHNGSLCTLKQLIEAGVSVDRLDENRCTPLHLAVKTLLYRQYEMAALLINSKCDLDIKDRHGRTPVMLAACHGRMDIVDLLLRRGAQVNCIDATGWTLLHYACNAYGHSHKMDIVRLILDNGEADLNAADQDGSTPLMLAYADVAAVLIEAGADVNRSNNRKKTALHCAAELGNTRLIQVLLEKEGLDLNPQDVNGNTPLHLACQQSKDSCLARNQLLDKQEAIKQLLDAGANTNMKNNQGRAALSEGICYMSLTQEEIRLFVQKGAFIENGDYKFISDLLRAYPSIFKGNVLMDVELCTQSVVNKFNRQSLPALYSINYFARRLPNVDTFKLGGRHVDEVENLIKCEIERNNFCNVVRVHPISLSALCVLSLITCQSGKKRADSPDFGPSSLKKKIKIHN